MSPLSYLRTILLWLATGLTGPGARCAGASEASVDLTGAVIVAPRDLSGPERKAVALLVDEVEKRTQIRWRETSTWPDLPGPVIAIGQATVLRAYSERLNLVSADGSGKPRREGYQIQVLHSPSGAIVRLLGNDARGVLFGVGRLLRALTLDKRKVSLPPDFTATSAPHYSLRGHQLGYRPKTNSYDGWDLQRWEQYIRDLTVFGTNAIELIPPRSDDAPDSPHFPRPPLETMVGMSGICAAYGLDVWVWYPALDKDYSDPQTVEFALKEWSEVFAKLPRIDAVFVPGGDPGHTQPKYLMALLEKQAASLHRYHPKATVWVSPQGFNPQGMDEFLGILRTEPAWLGGVVYGPGTRLTLQELRRLVPERYPIRHYPDITHSRTCQYPVPDWDTAFAMTEGREPINPRPRGEANIFRVQQPHTIGFVTYSEGCNDDVNKMIWSALGWDPDADVLEVLRDYSRYFIGPAYADSFAHGLLALEENWVGPVLTNGGIDVTLQQFQVMEKAASPPHLLNWRFQQALYRAYYDAYIRTRLLYETQLEDEALAALRRAPRIGSLVALSAAESILQRAVDHPVAEDRRARVFELAEALYQSVRMQLSVDRYKALSVNRGANLDTIDRPLNDRVWLLAQFAGIRKIDSETERRKRLDAILHWTDPGPGGFYDDAGNPSCQPHLVRNSDASNDPAFFHTPATVFEDRPAFRKSWWDQAMSHYDLPLTFRYTGLEPAAHYTVRVVYGSGPVQLVANEKYAVHPLLTRPYEPLEFRVPGEATASGTLELRWSGQPRRGGNGRGCQLAEVWLLKK